MSGDGTTALVGAIEDDELTGGNPGSAYVFDGSGDDWDRAARLAGDGESSDSFGVVSLSDDGSTALVGALADTTHNGR